MRDIQSILFIELLGGIGDVLIALPAIHALARSHPLARCTVLTFAPGSELLKTDPLIHRVIEAKKGEARRSVDHLLSRESFDLIISDTNYDGIAAAIQTHQTTSPHAPVIVTNLWRSPPPDQRVGDRFLKILQDEGLITTDAITPDQPHIHLTALERAEARQALGASYRPVIFLCPDAGMPIKRWAESNFVETGKALQQQYGATIVVPVGADTAQAERMVQAIGGTAQVWQRGSLRRLAAAIAEADGLVAADTGVARIAAALQVPTITLFGPSWHERYGQPAPHINLQGAPNCPDRLIHNFTEQSCWYSGECPFAWNTCLEDISPAQVLNAIAPLLKPKTNHASTQSFTHSLIKSPLFFSSSSPASVWRSLRNLLVMRLDNIGDVIMTTPVLRALREHLPAAKITLMASPAGALTAPLLPWVDDVLPWRVLWQDLGRLGFASAREWQLVETLKSYQFDAAIILTSFSQSPHPAGLICALAGIPLRLGESKEQDNGTLTHAVSPAPDAIHQADRNLRLIESVGFQVHDRRLALHLPTAYPPLPAPYILLNPWTTCQSRNYAPDRFAIAARQLSNLTGWSVVVTGVEKDRDRARSLMAALGDGAIDLVGVTSLTELVARVAGANLVLTNNTSTMHIADAFGVPNVVLFAGTEQESQWRPRHSPSRLLRRPTVCSPCYAFTCAYQLQCLDIAPEAVVEAALELLQTTGGSIPGAVSFSA